VSQFHFDPLTYLDMVRAEVPLYDTLQEEIAAAASVTATSILDLGTGTGETLAHVLPRHPGARAAGVDESPDMLAVARARLVDVDVTLAVADLGDVMLPHDPAAAVTPVDDDYDKPSTAADQVAWLQEAGLVTAVAWQRGDLAVFTADRPPSAH
jgi:tRNA (cmo5U34)-methyltransferase